MRLVIYSTVPWVGVGYGVSVHALVTRLKADGHYVEVASKHMLGGTLEVNGIRCYDGRELGLTSQLLRQGKFDYVISLMDVWTLIETFPNWIAVNFLDVELIFPKMIEVLRKSKYQTAVTLHGKRELERVGFKPFYTPLGVDTKVFKPDHEARKAYREKRGWKDDTFVIGLVGINYPNDRKNIIGLLRAFQGFHQRHPNSVVYLHTDVMGSATAGLPLKWVINSCGFESEGTGPVQFVSQELYHLWDISHAELAKMYNGFDVLCLPTQGEGFGLPYLESQSCGVPVISADTTSGRELNFGGWLIPVVEDNYHFSTHLSWYARVFPSQINEYLEKAYEEWESGEIKKRKEEAQIKALEYDWDVVYEKYWRPMLSDVNKGNILVNSLPNYGSGLYETFTGRILMNDCGMVCADKSICDKKYPLLPNEWEGPRCILSRSYPVIPDKNGTLKVLTECSCYKSLSPRFISECKNAWSELWGYPEVRREVEKLWDEGFFNGETIDLDKCHLEFDSEYKNVFQSNYGTVFDFKDEMFAGLPSNARILDVGCGNGSRVKELRIKGYDSVGCEINSSWIDGDSILFGNSEDLPFDDNSFDMVLSVDVLEHLNNPLKAIKELFRVSKNKVVVQVTVVTDSTYYEDPTHKVPWDFERWKREFAEFGTIVRTFNPTTIVMEKRNA